MIADLHVHSNYSDGSNTVEEIIEIAREKGVSLIGLVDHDTIRGIEHARQVGNQSGITVIPGIEISAYDFKRNRKVHILGYGFQKEAMHIQQLCEPLLQRRHANSLWQIEQLQANGYKITCEEVVKHVSSGGIIYKQHIMACLTTAHFTTSVYKKLYKELFKGDGICARDIDYVDAIEAVRAIKEDGGLAVLAHPGQLNSFDLIPELVQNGLDGIERNHFDHSEEDMKRVEAYAKEFSLFLTGGSDFHGNFGAAIQLGEVTCPVDTVQRFMSIV